MVRLLAFAALALPACRFVTVRETGTGGTGVLPSGPNQPTVDTYEATCVTPTRYNGALRTIGWTNGVAVLNIWEANAVAGWSEEHLLLATAYGPNSAWEVLEVTLEQTTPGGPLEPGQTVFSCAEGAAGGFLDDTLLTYAVRIYDVDGALADCVAFGFNPSAVAAGTLPNGGGDPSEPTELVGCRVP